MIQSTEVWVLWEYHADGRYLVGLFQDRGKALEVKRKLEDENIIDDGYYRLIKEWVQ